MIYFIYGMIGASSFLLGIGYEKCRKLNDSDYKANVQSQSDQSL
ncbi:hypothetical protein NUZ5A_20402 [Candidatus Nitrosotenuis uzonensis]|uniref:Uncharacterized protein n=1 Tax=Candidatus Nitrosotenuis uzonensis TaxID=1407055 RepID=A0A812EU85_9ARCH|nr:hypothetical protein NUZ5A_20402 [Candidatus Nitrosotenuis uzonensis]